jgi:glycine/D-amino acid oxidase-like deaminating enzyme
LWTLPAGILDDEAPLGDNEQCNLIVVGAGIAGLTTAYLAAMEGKSVIVLDDGPVGGGETGRTTAHLSNALDDRYSELARLHGDEGARLAAESHTKAIDKIEQIVRDEGIACEFERVDGYLFLTPGADPELLKEEMRAAHDAGLGDVEWVERAPVPGIDTGRCLKFPGQAQFHPLKYLAGLARAVQREGGEIQAGGYHVEKVVGGDPAWVVVQGGAIVRGSSIVVATGTPFIDLFQIHTKQASYRTYVIGALIPKGSVTRALFWDTGDPYNYVRVQSLSAQHDVLIVGGEDHKTGQAQDTDARFERLEDWARERFPMIERVEYRWSGQVEEPFDGLAFIGHNPHDAPNVYIATGDSGHADYGSHPEAGQRVGYAVRSQAEDTARARPIRERKPQRGQAISAARAAGRGEDCGRDPGGTWRGDAARHAVDGGVSRRCRTDARAVGRLSSFGMRGGLELDGADLGLPLPWIAFRCDGQGDLWTSEPGSGCRG